MTDAWMWTALAAIVIAGGWLFGAEATSGTPPKDQPEHRPTDHEVKQALADLRTSLERLQDVLERQHDRHDDALSSIQRQLDRIESTRRLEDALTAIHRQKET